MKLLTPQVLEETKIEKSKVYFETDVIYCTFIYTKRPKLKLVAKRRRCKRKNDPRNVVEPKIELKSGQSFLTACIEI